MNMNTRENELFVLEVCQTRILRVYIPCVYVYYTNTHYALICRILFSVCLNIFCFKWRAKSKRKPPGSFQFLLNRVTIFIRSVESISFYCNDDWNETFKRLKIRQDSQMRLIIFDQEQSTIVLFFLSVQFVSSDVKLKSSFYIYIIQQCVFDLSECGNAEKCT